MVRCRFSTMLVLLLSGCGSSLPTKPTLTGAAPGTTFPRAEGGLVLASGEGELGDGDYGQRKTTIFTVKNDSDRPFNLFVADKSCQCAGVEIRPALVQPGETTQVTVAWAPKVDQPTTEVIRVRTTIQAQEDPNVRLQLEADGRIKPTLEFDHPRGLLNFGKLLVGELKSGQKELALEVYTQDVAKKKFTLQAKSLSPGIQVSPPEPLTSDRLAAFKAVAGYRINIRAVEGLPIGAFRETVRLTSDVYPERDLDVTVEGTVESGAVGLSSERVDLPKLSIAKGYSCPPLEIELRGEPGRKVSIEKIEPKFLKARLEPVTGKDNVWRLHVSVPAGEAELRKDLSAEQLSEYTSYGFDGGAIVLKTDHSRLPVLRIPVSEGQFQK